MSLLKSGISLLVKVPLNARIPILVQNVNCLACKQRWASTKTPTDGGGYDVYYGALTPHIKGVKMFSLTTSAAGLIAQPVLYQQVSSFGGGMPMIIALGSFVGFFTFLTPLLLHSITKKYVTKITYSPEDGCYSATTYTFFLRPRTVKFRPEDVDVPDIPGMFTSFHVKGQPMFVDPRLFENTHHYAKIMGYDKPIDFKLGEISDEPNPKKD